MTDLLTRAWNALTPEQRPEMMQKTPAGNYWHDRKWMLPTEVAYDRLCVACERVLLREGCEPVFTAKGQWGGCGVLDEDRWEWYFADESLSHHDQLTAAVLAIDAMKGGNDER